jgi:predicted Fe-Mo cluster-binding NifX family protein
VIEIPFEFYLLRGEQMRVVVSANGVDLDASASPVFGRCPVFVFVDVETMGFEAVENPALAASGGAGIQAAQFVIERGAEAVITGNVGPNAFDVFNAAGVPVYQFAEGTVRETVEAHLNGELAETSGASALAHAGMRGGGGARQHTAMSSTISKISDDERKEEIAELTNLAGELRKQLAEVMERLVRLEKGD